MSTDAQGSTDGQFARLRVTRKSGEEQFRADEHPIGCSLLEFWQWSVSDLVSNATRGRLAEFIVAKALGISTDGVRDEWAAFDLVTRDGTLIEVKSAAYVQSWNQPSGYSKIQFLTPKTKFWDAEKGMQTCAPKRQADIYIFAVLAHMEKSTVDPLNVSHWRFYVLPTRVLDDRIRSRHSITLKSVEMLSGGPVDFFSLPKAVNAVGLPVLNKAGQ